MTDKAALWISIVSVGISIISVIAAVLSSRSAGKNVKIAEEAKEQAKQAALFEPRTKAIEHIRQAHAAITNNGFVADEELVNLRAAKDISELAFGSEVQEALAQAHSKALDLSGKEFPERKGQAFKNALNELGKKLQSLLNQMNREAKLGR